MWVKYYYYYRYSPQNNTYIQPTNSSTMPSVELAASEQKLGDQFLGGNVQARTRALKPLTYSGTLDSFKNQDLTPVVGREYEGLQVRDLLRWGDDMIRDLAVTSKS